MCMSYLRELGMAGERKEPVSASVAMVHCIPELIVSEEVCIQSSFSTCIIHVHVSVSVGWSLECTVVLLW